MDWILLAEDRAQRWDFMNIVVNFWVCTYRAFIDFCNTELLVQNVWPLRNILSSLGLPFQYQAHRMLYLTHSLP